MQQFISERVQKNWKILNLPPAMMSHGSFIVIRSSCAQNNQLVRPLDYAALSADTQKPARKDYKQSFLDSEIEGRKSWNLTDCTNTKDRINVTTVSRIRQRIIKTLYMRWGMRKGHGVMYACECRQKGHFLLNFLTGWSVESTNTAHTKFQSESKS